MLGSFLNENSIHEHVVGMILINEFFFQIFFLLRDSIIIDFERLLWN